MREKLKTHVYLEVAKNIAKLSKDRNTQIGCVIVAKDGTPVSWGYNGAVSGFRDDVIPHSREEKNLSYCEDTDVKRLKLNKYPFMCHAEGNALDFGNNEKLQDATVYLTGMPCGPCALNLAKHKIKRLVVAPVEYETESTLNRDDDLAKYILAEAEIELFVGDKKIMLEKN